jgi:hypothetical protein
MSNTNVKYKLIKPTELNLDISKPNLIYPKSIIVSPKNIVVSTKGIYMSPKSVYTSSHHSFLSTEELSLSPEDNLLIEFVTSKLNCTQQHLEDTIKAIKNKDNPNFLYKRLSRIVLMGDIALDTIPQGVQTWDMFCDRIPEWRDQQKSYVCFRDDENYKSKNVLKQRVQNSALCYLHAPSLLVYYLYKKTHPEFNEIIDITAFIRNNFTKELLTKHIFEDFGGNSLQIFKDITKHEARIKACNIEEIDKNFLVKYGPVLAHSFLIYDDMIDMNISSHTIGNFKNSFAIISSNSISKLSLGQISQISLSDLSISNVKNTVSDISDISDTNDTKQIPDKCHALLLIGVRTDNKNKKYYLFQNWWREKQFFEADEEYLIQCEVELHYAAEKVVSIQNNIFLYGEYFETNCDVCEKSPNHDIYNASPKI